MAAVRRYAYMPCGHSFSTLRPFRPPLVSPRPIGRLSDALWQPLPRSEALKTSVAGPIVGHNTVLPHPKDHPYPCPSQDADGVRMIAPSGSRSLVDVLRPRVVLARALSQGR